MSGISSIQEHPALPACKDECKEDEPLRSPKLLNEKVLEEEKEDDDNKEQHTEAADNATRRLIGASVLLFSLTSDGLNVPCMLLARDSAAQWSGNRRDVYTDFGGSVSRRHRWRRYQNHQRCATKPALNADNNMNDGSDVESSSSSSSSNESEELNEEDDNDKRRNDKSQDDKSSLMNCGMNAEAVAAREFAEESLVGSIRYFQTNALNHPASLRLNVEQSLLRKVLCSFDH